MNINKTSVGAIILSVIAVIGTFAFHPTKTVVQPVQSEKVGAASPDFSNSYFLTVNGVKEYYMSEQMKTGTTTVCSFPNPAVVYDGASSTAFTATSTLQYISYHITSGIGSAVNFEIATSTNAQGSTSDLVTAQSVPANTTSFSSGWIANSWNAGNFASGWYANVVLATTSTSTITYGGTCQAEWTQI